MGWFNHQLDQDFNLYFSISHKIFGTPSGPETRMCCFRMDRSWSLRGNDFPWNEVVHLQRWTLRSWCYAAWNNVSWANFIATENTGPDLPQIWWWIVREISKRRFFRGKSLGWWNNYSNLARIDGVILHSDWGALMGTNLPTNPRKLRTKHPPNLDFSWVWTPLQLSPPGHQDMFT